VHLDLGKGAALARWGKVPLQHDPEFTLMLQDIARLDIVATLLRLRVGPAEPEWPAPSAVKRESRNA
jgi:hypothetical protein